MDIKDKNWTIFDALYPLSHFSDKAPHCTSSSCDSGISTYKCRGALGVRRVGI